MRPRAINDLVQRLDGFSMLSHRMTFYSLLCMLPFALSVAAENLLPRLRQNGDRVYVLPAAWEFRQDPDVIGLDTGWQNGMDASEAWQPLLTTRHWADQLTDPAIRQRQDPRGIQLTGRDTYYGIGWYRINFFKPSSEDGNRLILELGGVEESCWVFVNGIPVGAQVYDGDLDPLAWNKPRRFDITRAIHEGTNRLVIRVQALGGLTGIYGGAVIREMRPNHLADGCILSDRSDWTFIVTDATAPGTAVLLEGRLDQTPLPGFFIRGDGEYVEEHCLAIRLPPGRSLRLSREQTPPPSAGAYLLRIRYQQSPEPGAQRGVMPPFHARIRCLAGHDGDASAVVAGAERSSPTLAAGQWETLFLPLMLPEIQDQDDDVRLILDLFFKRPGVYRLGEMILSQPFP